MKKILLFLTVISLYPCIGQEEIYFKVGYLPNHQYTLSQKNILEISITYITSDEMLEALKMNGIENPMINRDTTWLKSSIRTKSLQNDEIPIEMEWLESNNSELKPGTKLFGKSKGQNIAIDSIVSYAMTEENKKYFFTSLEAMMNQIQLPTTQTVKVGESFEQLIPISIPAGNRIIDMDVKSIYTLKTVKDGIGFFDIEQVCTVNSEIEGLGLNFSGSGKGQLEYDINKEFFSNYLLDMVIDLTMDIEDIKLETKTKTTIEQTIEIQKAN